MAGAARQVAGQAGDIGALLHLALHLQSRAEQPGHRQQQEDAQPGRQARKDHGAGKQEDEETLDQAVAHRLSHCCFCFRVLSGESPVRDMVPWS
ncbi:hypothetical protein D3C76_1355890 [compost metagenome]